MRAKNNVSIHAPAGGATGAKIAVDAALSQFQSTRPRGARLDWANDAAVYLDVSIHAPAGGATIDEDALYEEGICFNPRARGGRDIL